MVFRKKKTSLLASFDMRLLPSFKTNRYAHRVKATKTAEFPKSLS